MYSSHSLTLLPVQLHGTFLQRYVYMPQIFCMPNRFLIDSPYYGLKKSLDCSEGCALRYKSLLCLWFLFLSFGLTRVTLYKDYFLFDFLVLFLFIINQYLQNVCTIEIVKWHICRMPKHPVDQSVCNKLTSLKKNLK